MQLINALFGAVLDVIYLILDLYVWMLIIGAIISWLVAFNVINSYNRFVQTVSDFIKRLTEPVLRPIRQVIPPVNGLDLSPLVLIIVIVFLKSFVLRLRF
jgi:YggT family protein